MKLLKVSALILAFGLIFTGCGKKSSERVVRKPSENIDSTKWIDNLIDGKAAAVKENKKIFLFFSADDQDFKSAEFKKNCFDQPEFLEKATKDYVLVNLDFSTSKFEAAQADPLASEEEKKAAGDLMALLEENMRDATLYNIQGSPCFYILTKEGYVISEVIFEEGVNSIEDFDKMMESKAEEIAVYNNVLASTETGDKDSKLKAINKLFEITDPQLRYLLKDKAVEYIKLDKKNETGAVGGYIIAAANADAVQAYLDQDPARASEEFAKAAENKYVTPEQKQQAFYTAGYLLAGSENADQKKVKEYLQKAYDADPESEAAPAIQSMMNMLDEDYQRKMLQGITSGEGAPEGAPADGTNPPPAGENPPPAPDSDQPPAPPAASN